MANDFLFAEETEEELVEEHASWKVMVVDDEPEVHAVTKLALSDFQFQNRNLEFISAHSGEEAKKLIVEHPDTAIVLLDVVMETDDAGLKVAEYIRQEAKNNFTRIILRTGQPGQAPERDVIVNYDINDYKSKTELTAQKLFTVVMATLRSYRDILALEVNRQGLEKIIEASADIFSIHSLEHFIEGIMQQLTSIIGGSEEAAFVMSSAVCGPRPINSMNREDLYIFAGQGEYKDKEGKAVKDVLDGHIIRACQDALLNKNVVYGDDFVVAYCTGKSSSGSLFYVSGLPRELNDSDKRMVDVFAQNVQIAFENVLLTHEIEDTQREIVVRLSEAVETRSEETGNHAKRVANYCHILAKACGLSDDDAETVKLASPLHDIGKIGTPDNILAKPGKLDESEWEIMKQHAMMGYNILKDSRRPIIQAAAFIARDHHEKWDGSGYPNGAAGKDIHLYGRIAALADVFDALRNKRCYKEAWDADKTVEYIKSESGKQFDPVLVNMFVAKVDEFEAILKSYPDEAGFIED